MVMVPPQQMQTIPASQPVPQQVVMNSTGQPHMVQYMPANSYPSLNSLPTQVRDESPSQDDAQMSFYRRFKKLSNYTPQDNTLDTNITHISRFDKQKQTVTEHDLIRSPQPGQEQVPVRYTISTEGDVIDDRRGNSALVQALDRSALVSPTQHGPIQPFVQVSGHDNSNISAISYSPSGCTSMYSQQPLTLTRNQPYPLNQERFTGDNSGNKQVRFSNENKHEYQSWDAADR